MRRNDNERVRSIAVDDYDLSLRRYVHPSLKDAHMDLARVSSRSNSLSYHDRSDKLVARVTRGTSRELILPTRTHAKRKVQCDHIFDLFQKLS